MKVIVCDADQRSALAVVRSLARAGHDVIVAAHRYPALAALSRGAAASFLCADPSALPNLFADQVEEAAARAGADLVIPLTDASCFALAPTSAAKRVFGPSIESLEQAADKAAMTSLAEEQGIPVPKTLYLERGATPPPTIFPIIVKPRRSRVRENGRVRALAVRAAVDGESLDRLLSDLPAGAFPVLLQEMIVGDGVGYFALCRDGEVLAEFFHRRIRELPVTGGVSVLREATPPDPAVRDGARRLLAALRWTGPAMVEFKRGVDGHAYFMELNGRFWGSLQLAIDAGVDFPALLVKAAQGEGFALPAYRPAARLRHVAGDVEALATVLAKGAPGGSRLRYLLSWLQTGGRWEIERWSDLQPAFHEWASLFAKFRRLARKRLTPVRTPGVIHSHTTYSHDGELDAAALADHLERQGLGFVVITEHENSMNAEKYRSLIEDCRKLSRPGFVLIPGIEFATPRRTHILGINVSEFFDEHDPAKIVAGIHERGGIAVLAHPDATKFERDEAFLTQLDGAEAWNAVHDSPFVPSVRNIEAIREIRRVNPGLSAWGGIDFHRPGHYRGMRVIVEAGADREAILQALRESRFRVRGRLFGYRPGRAFSVMDRAYVSAFRLLLQATKPLVLWSRGIRRTTFATPGPPAVHRVAHTIETGNPGGAERVLLHIIDQLPSDRFQPFALPAKRGWLEEQLRERSVPVDITPVGTLGHPRHIIRLARALRRNRIALLQSHELYMNVHGALAARLAGARHVAVVHGNLEYMAPWYRRAGYHLALALGTRVVTVSFALREDLARVLNIPRNRIGVIRNGVAIPPPVTPERRAEARQRLGVGDEPVIAVIGSLYPVKGHAVLLQALPDILAVHPRTRVFFIGRGLEEVENDLRSRAAAFQGAVVFTGYRDDVEALLPGVDVVAVPSLYEGLSLTLCEAMAGGVPVVATDVGGNSEVVADGLDGLLVPAGDARALANALIAVLSDPDRRRALGEAARGTAIRHFSIERMTRSYWENYAELLGDDRPPRQDAASS